MTRLKKIADDSEQLRHPASPEYGIDQQFVNMLWEAWQQGNRMWNMCGARNLPGKRECIGLSVFPSSFGNGFTASVRARETCKNPKSFVIYSSAMAADEALYNAITYACDPEAEWKEAKAWQRDQGAETSSPMLKPSDLMP